MIYDFSKPKVRKNGVVLNKFSLGLELLDWLDFDKELAFKINKGVFTYNELKEILKSIVKCS